MPESRLQLPQLLTIVLAETDPTSCGHGVTLANEGKRGQEDTLTLLAVSTTLSHVTQHIASLNKEDSPSFADISYAVGEGLERVKANDTLKAELRALLPVFLARALNIYGGDGETTEILSYKDYMAGTTRVTSRVQDAGEKIGLDCDLMLQVFNQNAPVDLRSTTAQLLIRRRESGTVNVIPLTLLVQIPIECMVYAALRLCPEEFSRDYPRSVMAFVRDFEDLYREYLGNCDDGLPTSKRISDAVRYFIRDKLPSYADQLILGDQSNGMWLNIHPARVSFVPEPTF
jgi:hypothetical protein